MNEFTMEVRLCDDDGMVSHERVEPGSPGTAFDPDLTYLKLLNNLRAHTAEIRRGGRFEPVTEPFPCTGSAHQAGEHIRCTSPAHNHSPAGQAVVLNAYGPPWVAGTAEHTALLSPAGSRIVSANGYCHVCGDSLVRPDNAPETLFCCRCQSERSYA